jgi:hypothetical protein
VEPHLCYGFSLPYARNAWAGVRARPATPTVVHAPRSRPTNDMTLLTTVVPAIGTVLAALLGASGVPGMLGDRRVGSLSTDPTPFPVAFTANVAWCVYGVSLGDFWPFLCNIAPSLCNLFCTITCLRLSGSVSARVAVRIEILMLVGMAILLALMLLSCSSLVVASEAHRQAIASGACLTLCICQFLSPCTEAVFAALRGDASKLSLPLAGTGALCCGFWCVYGLAAEQPAMAISNGIGCLLSVSVALTKLVVGFLHAPTGGGADGTPTEVLLKLADEGKEIQLHSISQELASPLGARRQRQTTAEPADVLADQPAISASATPPPPSAAAWSLVKVGDGHVAFRLAEGGFLCVAPRAGDLPADLCTPTGFVIEVCAPATTSTRRDNNGPSRAVVPRALVSARTRTIIRTALVVRTHAACIRRDWCARFFADAPRRLSGRRGALPARRRAAAGFGGGCDAPVRGGRDRLLQPAPPRLHAAHAEWRARLLVDGEPRRG